MMNWIYISIGVLAAVVIFLLFLILPKSLNSQLKNGINWLGSYVQPIMFTIINFSLILAYYILNVLVENKYGDIFGEFMSPFWIIFSWYLSGKLVERIDATLPMKKEDKNFGYLLSVNSVILFAIIMSLKETDIEYLHIASLSFAILIGAYIPIDIYFSTERIIPHNERLKCVFSNFRASKRTVILSSATSALLLIFAIFSNRLDYVNNVFNQISLGFACGVLVMTIVLCIIFRIKNKKE